MPIILAPPSPLGSAASIGIGAGIAEQNAKQFSTLAQLYAHIASLHGQHGASGGTQGSSSVSPGAGGEGAFPSGYDPASEQQANRDQQTQNLQTELSADPVAKHIQMQHDFKMQQQQSAQQSIAAREAAANAPPAQPSTRSPMPVQFGQAEQEELNEANQVVARTKKAVDSGELAPENGQMLMAPYQDKVAALTQQQQAATQAAEQQKNQADMRQDLHGTALNLARAKALSDGAATTPADITGIPDKNVVNSKGDLVNVNEKKQLKMMDDIRDRRNHAAAAEEKAETRRMNIEKHEQTMEHAATKEYIATRQHYVDRLNKEEDAFMNDKKSDGNRVRATTEGFDNTIAERMKAQGLAPTIGEFTERWQKKRGTWKEPASQAGSGAPSGTPVQHDMSTAHGQLGSLDQFLAGKANATPTPAPRKTTEPPGEMSLINKARAAGNWLGSGVPDPTMPAY